MNTYIAGCELITELTAADVAELITAKYGVPTDNIQCGNAMFWVELNVQPNKE